MSGAADWTKRSRFWLLNPSKSRTSKLWRRGSTAGACGCGAGGGVYAGEAPCAPTLEATNAMKRAVENAWDVVRIGVMAISTKELSRLRAPRDGRLRLRRRW